MRILGIETSCDETAAAIVEDGKDILAHTVASSKQLHEKTGGIIPEIAAREQVQCMIPVLEETLNQSPSFSWTSIDAIAITVGPGLIGSLLVGVETAKTIAGVLGKPLIPVNHVHAHIYAAFLHTKVSKNAFPAIALVVSGGHTELFRMEALGTLKWLGGTLDDAAGEAYDKTARMMGLGFGGGAAIAAEAAKFKAQGSKFKIKLPRPMMHKDSFDFSFSGLKTAVMREIKKLQDEKQWNEVAVQALAYEIQEAISDVLVAKTLNAAKKNKAVSIALGGGVAANARLREKLREAGGNLQLFFPDPALCTDNAVMIAAAAYYRGKNATVETIDARPALSVEAT